MTPLPLADRERVGAYGRTPLPLTALPKYLASLRRDYRFSLEKLEVVINKSRGAIKDVVWALGLTCASCPDCAEWPAGAGGEWQPWPASKPWSSWGLMIARSTPWRPAPAGRPGSCPRVAGRPGSVADLTEV
jgi:hypothetical protein